jgi:hypothetical protein
MEMKKSYTLSIRFFYYSIILLCSLFKVTAQTALQKKINTDIKITKEDINQRIDIEIKSNKTIDNLLIVITNTSGETVFLDNKYRFDGDYKHSVDLNTLPKGKYLVKINKNNERFEKKILLK